MLRTKGWTSSFDGTEIYFEVYGNKTDKPPLVLCDGIGCFGYAWKYIYQDFMDDHTIVHWHYRGHGQSAMPEIKGIIPLTDLVRDMKAVFDRLGLPPAILVGHSMGVQVILEFWRQHPDLVAGLVPMCGSYGNPLDTFHDNPVAKTIFPYLRRLFPKTEGLFRAFWSKAIGTELGYLVAINTEVNGRLIKKDDFFPYLKDLSSVDPELFINMLWGAQEHSAKEYLGSINVPTLIIGGERDGFTPVWLSEQMVRAIPGAQLLMVPQGSHTALLEMPELVSLKLQKWMAQYFAPAAPAAPTVEAPLVAPAAPAPKKAVKKAAKAAAPAPVAVKEEVAAPVEAAPVAPAAPAPKKAAKKTTKETPKA